MKIAKMFKWYWQNTYWAMVGFYGAMLALLLLGFFIVLSTGGGEEVSVNNLSFSAEIMLLVMGILFFPSGVRFGLSNGVSRKTVFLGLLLCLASLSAGMMLVNTVLEQIGSCMGLQTQNFQNLIYPDATGFGGWVRSFLCQISGGLLLGMLGYFIGGAYYRMSKIWKIVVSITVPALLFLGIPLLFVAFPSMAEGALIKLFFSLLDWILLSPYCLALLCLGFAALLGVFSWLLIRKAPVKIAG